MANEIGNTEVGVTKQDLLTGIVQDELTRSAILAPTLRDLSSMVGPGMKSVSLHDTGAFTAEAKTENTSLNKQILTFVNDTLNLDQHEAVLASIEDISQIQSMADVEGEVVSRSATAIVRAFDDYIYSKLKLASSAAPDHRIAYGNATTIAEVDILEAKRLLSVSEVPEGDRFLLIPPTQEKAMLQISNFIQADRYGSSEALRNGELGRVFGFTVLVSTVAESDNLCVAYHKDSVAWAWQKQVSLDSQKDLDNLSTKYAMSAIFGAKELAQGVKQVLIGSAV